ncbi:maleylpyruvate isomerase family mycothiol-dependent enzyme [Microbispora corallina]|uniref:maleylpyruvate isomerase family mycothiol-dependent enzyme n=1 Tax=Microbispora corallina TaxID=83302 RepID=UPI001951F0D3|nr:maleylpyruvate isomerase family mycothiol-dependent enzyme [Microbispora corallina]
MTVEHGFMPAVLLDQIVAATEQVLDTAARFSNADVREPSLLAGWSRGHVLTHLARNADGGSRLLVWARTGVETPEYPSMEARAKQIEAGASRGSVELVADVRDSAAQFAAEYARMPASAWERVIRWTGGQAHPAARAADSRLCEVLVHHVDLRAGYTPEQWPADFTRDMLSRVVRAFASRSDVSTMRLHATDSDAWYEVGAAAREPVVHGSQSSLLAWLMGRSEGVGLAAQGDKALPELPFLY